jgi:hypothetical protein
MKKIAAYGLGGLCLVLMLRFRIISTESRQEQVAIEPTQADVSLTMQSLGEAPPVNAPIRAPRDSLGGETAQSSSMALNGQDLQIRAASVPIAELRTALEKALMNTNDARLSELLLRRWAATDPVAAGDWAAHFSGYAFQAQALRQVGISWAKTDPAAAYNWLAGLPDDQNRQEAIISVAYETSGKTPTTALEMAGTLAPTPERDELLVHAIRQWGAADFSSASEWATAVPEPELRERLLAAIATDLAEQNGAEAANLVAQLLPAGVRQDRSAVSIVQRWAQKAPEEATAWASQFPEGAARTSAMQNITMLQKNH